jgi:hypothetical protein
MNIGTMIALCTGSFSILVALAKIFMSIGRHQKQFEIYNDRFVKIAQDVNALGSKFGIHEKDFNDKLDNIYDVVNELKENFAKLSGKLEGKGVFK